MFWRENSNGIATEMLYFLTRQNARFFKSLKPQRDQNLIQLKQTLTLEKKGPKGQKEGQDRE